MTRFGAVRVAVAAVGLAQACFGLRVVGRRAALDVSASFALFGPAVAQGRCADIETCREIGDRKVEAAEAANPTVRLADGVRYKQLKAGSGPALGAGDVADVAYSISTAGGSYMYSRGLGFEKDATGAADTGDFLRVRVGDEAAARAVPRGIELALVGMRRGERRRVELPPGPDVGFESSDWRPEPTSRRGKSTIVGYRQILKGNGSSQPPFPALTVWDVEVRRIR